MKAPFNHFVVTRFNLKQNIWDKDKDGGSLSTDKWLKERYELFEKYCYPSLQYQSIKNFKWLVYFDENTPDLFKEKNKLLQKEFDNFTPVYVSDFSHFEKELPKYIKENSIGDVDFVLTTRLDNDDCFHKDAIKTIQQHFEPKKKAIIDLKNGLALQVFGEYKLSLKTQTKSGPFITLIEKLNSDNELLTVYDKEHLKWINDAIFIDIDTGYYWLQTIHRRNVLNGLSNQLTFNNKYLIGYHFSKDVKFTLRYYVFILFKRLKLFNFIK